MKLDLYVIREGERLRCGYTTGSCAQQLLRGCSHVETGEIPNYVEIDTPAGVRLKLEINNPKIKGMKASCSVVKDGG